MSAEEPLKRHDKGVEIPGLSHPCSSYSLKTQTFLLSTAYLTLGDVLSAKLQHDKAVKSFKHALRAVERLPYALPTKANQLASVAAGQPQREEAIARMAAGTAPFLHARTWRLASRFLEVKQRVGSAVERREYAGMQTAAFVTRLLSRRPLVFMDARDIYLTQTGEQGEGKELFLKIGSSKEAAPLTLSRYLS